MPAPAWWQVYLIAGAIHSLFIIYRPGFAERYWAFAAKSLTRTTARSRVIIGCFAMATCIAIWPVFIVLGALMLTIGFIAGMMSGGRK